MVSASIFMSEIVTDFFEDPENVGYECQNQNPDSLLQYEYDLEDLDDFTSENLLQKINKFVKNEWEVVDVYSHSVLVKRLK